MQQDCLEMGFLGFREEGNSIKRFDESMPFFATTQRNRCLLGVEACASLGEDRGAEEDEGKKGRHAKYVISTPGSKPFES